MTTDELFSSLLGLTSGWEVDSVALSLATSEVEIRVRHVGRLVLRGMWFGVFFV